MKNSLIILLSIITTYSLSGAGIQFESSLAWEQVLTKAQNENKIIFVVAYSESCPNCEFMETNVYPENTVGTAFNNKYLNLKQSRRCFRDTHWDCFKLRYL